MNKHQKHPKLIRAEKGQFGRNEWAFHGTACGTIQQWSREIIQRLQNNYRIAYVDTDHQSFKEELKADFLDEGAIQTISDKQGFHQITNRIDNPDFSLPFSLQAEDIVLINGNHHQGQKQIVFLDENKVKSLEKRKDRLSDIQAFITIESYNVVPTHIIEKNSDYQGIPVFNETDYDAIAELIRKTSQQKQAKIKALVLAGGKSQRMGKDKSEIVYHQKVQREHLADMLSSLTEEVYVSCRPEQTETMETSYPLLPDRIQGMGPYGAILSAFMHDPNAAWLVVACDLPMLNTNTIEQLIQERNASKMATAFKSPVNEFPEPLIAIWEPKSYMRLLQFMSFGYSCPRKVLINSECAILDAQEPANLFNVNTPEDEQEAKKRIAQHA